MSFIYCHLNFHANLLRPWCFPLKFTRWQTIHTVQVINKGQKFTFWLDRVVLGVSIMWYSLSVTCDRFSTLSFLHICNMTEYCCWKFEPVAGNWQTVSHNWDTKYNPIQSECKLAHPHLYCIGKYSLSTGAKTLIKYCCWKFRLVLIIIINI
jgi:hypothetical protein